MTQYDNVILGNNNSVDGHKNVIVGSYNDIKGSNNFVLIEKFVGQANGDLMVGKWKIQIDQKQLILINASLAISYTNENENRQYLGYLTQNRGFSYGSSGSTDQSSLSVIPDTSVGAQIATSAPTQQQSQS